MGFVRDVRFAVRSLAKSRTTAAAAILVLALGTGVNTAVVAVTYGILLRPLPYQSPSRIVVIELRAPGGQDIGVPAAEFDEWNRRLRSVETLAAYSIGEFTVRGIGAPRVVRIALVHGGFFEVLRAPSLRGTPGGASDGWVAVSSRLARQLAGDRDLVGATTTIGDGAYRLSAIMPDSFAFPSEETVAWLPASTHTVITLPGRPDARSFRLFGRLAPGVSAQQAAEEATRALREIRPAEAGASSRPKAPELKAVVRPLDEVLTGRVRPVLAAITVAAILVLLVACANVASLLIGRAVARQRDAAVRLALGATRWQMVRSVAAESLILACAASLVGVWLGALLARLFVAVAAGVLPRLDAVAVDLPVLAASALTAFLVALACGVAPALHASRGDLAPTLRATRTPTRPARKVRAALTAGQIALSVVLIAGAGLIVRTVTRLLDQADGLDQRHVVSLRLAMTDRTTFAASDRVAFVRRLAERVRHIPGVRGAGIGSGLPPRVAPLSMGVRVVSKGHEAFQVLTLVSVTPGYLPALGARLVRGRMFEAADLDGDDPIALLSESAARHLSPTHDPVGRPLVFPVPGGRGGPARPQVVGVVDDIRFAGLDSASVGAVYVLWPTLPVGVGYLVVRADGDALALAPALNRAVLDLDPAMPVPEVRRLRDEVLASIADRRLRLVPAIGFAALALAVALLGLGASINRAVVERRQELAIRGALGSSPARLVATVLVEGAWVVAAGLVIGVGMAFAVGRLLARLLYGVGPADPASFATAAALVATTALAVSYAAARRALRIDVLESLRAE